MQATDPQTMKAKRGKLALRNKGPLAFGFSVTPNIRR